MSLNMSKIIGCYLYCINSITCVWRSYYLLLTTKEYKELKQ